MTAYLEQRDGGYCSQDSLCCTPDIMAPTIPFFVDSNIRTKPDNLASSRVVAPIKLAPSNGPV